MTNLSTDSIKDLLVTTENKGVLSPSDINFLELAYTNMNMTSTSNSVDTLNRIVISLDDNFNKLKRLQQENQEAFKKYPANTLATLAKLFNSYLLVYMKRVMVTHKEELVAYMLKTDSVNPLFAIYKTVHKAHKPAKLFAPNPYDDRTCKLAINHIDRAMDRVFFNGLGTLLEQVESHSVYLFDMPTRRATFKGERVQLVPSITRKNVLIVEYLDDKKVAYLESVDYKRASLDGTLSISKTWLTRNQKGNK